MQTTLDGKNRGILSSGEEHRFLQNGDEIILRRVTILAAAI